MTPEEITALAREYAEEIRADILPFFPRPLPDSMGVLIKADQEKAERLIRFLLRRYYLIDREIPKKKYEAGIALIKGLKEEVCTNDSQWYALRVHFAECSGGMRVLDSLFPDLGKEVGNEKVQIPRILQRHRI